MNEILDPLHQPHVQMLLRLVVGGLLAFAGVTKLLDREGTSRAVTEYRVLPRKLEQPFAAALPWLELSLGTLLLTGLGITTASALAVPLFGSFAVAIAVNVARGRHFECHCFGSAHNDEVGWAALLRAIVLAGAALIIALGTSRFGSIEAAIFGSRTDLPPAVEVLPVLFIAFVIFDVLFLLPEALAFRRIAQQRRQTMITGMAHRNGHRHAEAARSAT